MPTDNKLLRDYARHRSESAFTELVKRHVDMVYAAALRETHGDTAQAEDVTQAVFSELALKASHLCRHPALAGWLYTCVRHKTANTRRADERRQQRELEAHTMKELLAPETPESEWRQLQPVLDDAMHELSETDRAAVVLRFFEDRSHTEVGLALGLSETAARKRVDRALETLRAVLGKRGITSTASGLTAAIAFGGVVTAPAKLAASVAAGAVAAAASTATTTFTLFKLVTMTKLQAGILCVIVIAGIATPLMLHDRTRPAQKADSPALETASKTAMDVPETSAFWRRVHALRRPIPSATARDTALRDALVRLEAALYAPPATVRPAKDPAYEILYALPLEQRAAALGLVMHALRDPNRHICLRAIRLVPIIWPQGEAALPDLFNLLRTKSAEWPEIATEAMLAAVQVRSESDIVPELVAAAMLGPANAEKALATQLPLLTSQIKDGDAAFAASLRPFLNSPDPAARLTAAQALAQLRAPKDPAVVSELTDSLSSPVGAPADTETIRASLGALLKMGPDARTAIPALLALADRTPDLRDSVHAVLKAIAPEALKGVGVPTPLPPRDGSAEAMAQQLATGAWTVQNAADALRYPDTMLSAARALADFGPGAVAALPALQQAFDAQVATNLPVALVLGATIERLAPDAPKPLLTMMDLMPAMEAIYAEVLRANHPQWNDALETLPQRVPIGLALRHDDVRRLAEELGRIHPRLRDVFHEKLLEADAKFAAILPTGGG
jgi:RNA polymerase sigma factor (sigma-70 family)